MWLHLQKVISRSILTNSSLGSFIVASFLQTLFCKFIYGLLMFLTDPAYVVAPGLPSRADREDLRKLFAGSTLTLPYDFYFSIFLLMFEYACSISLLTASIPIFFTSYCFVALYFVTWSCFCGNARVLKCFMHCVCLVFLFGHLITAFLLGEI